MLYGAPTGGAPPAPETEYILVSAVEAAGQAWVEIDAGIDINPAALQLPGVPADCLTEQGMDTTAQGSATVLGALGRGLPMLLLHFGLVSRC